VQKKLENVSNFTAFVHASRIFPEDALCAPPLAGDDEIDPSAAALAADKPLVPIRDGHLGAVAFRHLGRAGLDLVAAIEAPDDKPNARGRSVAERHRRAAVGAHITERAGNVGQKAKEHYRFPVPATQGRSRTRRA
jgi:hypothetical protein